MTLASVLTAALHLHLQIKPLLLLPKTLQTPVKDLIKGTTIAGRYQIIEELGRGGMGVVYKAEDTKLKRRVALKFLPPELTHMPDIKERFMREAQTAAALDHPNICTIHEFDEAEEKTFISMAYIEGQSLKKKIESGPLELDEALRIATQVAEGLQAAHKKGVVHRDIKSANIMMDERDQAKIMDFGLARKTGGTLLTKEGIAMGTISLLSGLCLCGKETLVKYFKAVTGRELTPGIIAVIQSFGSKINLHPHLHFLVSEGGSDREEHFHSVSRFNDDLLREIFAREVFSLLLHDQLINLTLVQKILRWRHTGFNVHSKVRATSKQEAERVGKYMIRPILSLKKLSFDETEGKVSYQYGKLKAEEERMDYLEFIARATSHIPDKGQVTLRYYGLYSNAHRGKMHKRGADPSHPPIIEDEALFVPSRGWAEMIRKVYELDPLLCPECGGQMSIISFIEDHKVIDKIIDHLKLTFMAQRPPPPQIVQQELLMAAEERGEYF